MYLVEGVLCIILNENKQQIIKMFPCQICIQSETTEEKCIEIERKRTGTEAISDTQKSFPLLLSCIKSSMDYLVLNLLKSVSPYAGSAPYWEVQQDSFFFFFLCNRLLMVVYYYISLLH